MKPLAVWLDRYAEEACPGLDQALAIAGALVLRCFDRTPSPSAVRRMAAEYRQAVVLGGRDRHHRVARVELATTTLDWPVIVLAPDEERRAFGAGVVDVLRPQAAEVVARRVVLMSEVPIITHSAMRSGSPEAASAPILTPPEWRVDPDAPQVTPVGIVSSTGGSFIVSDLLRAMRRPSGKAILLAQHLEAEFVPFFAEWLAGASGWPVRIVAAAVPLAPDTVFVAAGGMDLTVSAHEVRVERARTHWVPNGDTLLTSLAETQSHRAIGVVLSGMGGDGSAGLAAIAQRGGRALCQSPASAIVPSMPERALQKAPGALALPPDELAIALQRQ